MEPAALPSQEITSSGEVFKKQSIQRRSRLLSFPLKLNSNEVNLLLSEAGVGSHSVGSDVKKILILCTSETFSDVSRIL